ncbi:AI-2E family transporter [Paraburkholderia caballeronis]|uniref:Predicted PurR-regulated permease PerM n=1 Tax=Paraburkholderia caballeronis TaxID=416943 RepID=A0A1H7FZQ2_9BURK|nr:AI-2E family transporter [Paraburkholderia caballeronis]PXW24833.1 putative PurR-regulated permease PerM [Paraburkholderia caballeronis]PXX00563.1 putative PurR-regulated permease PerM [Paraburkholderia caballeronis]RAJ98626.1 putative PurR-regulated permease PerM [Paraburkholderia caballeronis]TDV16552.1 putative PurR-regulated permease PerM [Paraburkholderia caballeronis]TDV18948.1 putative PurR-regulated permease PerM [Paraburkholderia caballeronis]
MNQGLLKCTCAIVLATLIGWILHVGRSVLVPIAFGIIATYVIFGLAGLLRRIPYAGERLKAGLRYTIAATLMVFIVYLSVDLLLSDKDRLMALAPKYEATLLALLTKFAAFLHIETEASWTAIRRDLLATVDVQAIITATLSSVSSLIATIVVVTLYAAFFLVEHAKFRRKLVTFAGGTTQIVSVIDEVNAKIGTYLALKALLGVILGIASWVCMYFIGLEFAELWAVLIGLLNFIPYAGSLVSVALPTLLAALQFGQLSEAFAIFVALTVINFVVGHILDPWLMGGSLNLSPTVILISLAAWSSVWGIAGAFLAVPITVGLIIAFSAFDSTRRFAMLLTNDG